MARYAADDTAKMCVLQLVCSQLDWFVGAIGMSECISTYMMYYGCFYCDTGCFQIEGVVHLLSVCCPFVIDLMDSCSGLFCKHTIHLTSTSSAQPGFTEKNEERHICAFV